MTGQPYDVAIVGLGPTGATLANLCGSWGLRTVVFERSNAPYPQPRACHLDAEIARVLQHLGFEDDLDRVLTVSAGMEYVDADGTQLFTFEGFEREPILGWHEDYVFIQPELDTMLRAGLEQYQHVEVRIGAEAPGIDSLRELARFVVAADGAGSQVREHLDIRLHDLGFDERWLVVDVMLNDTAVPDLPAIIQQVCDRRRLATFVPSHAAHRRWEFRLAEDEPVPDVWRLVAPWGVTAANAQLVRAVGYRFHALVAERWRDGNVFLAGDAAHQMPPFMGQGMCSGIRDAANLAWKFAEVIHDGADEALLDTYEAERRPHLEHVTQLSIEAGSLLSKLAVDPTTLPEPDRPDPTRWSRLPGLDLGGEFPVGHQLPQPDRLDEGLPDGWAWVAADDTFVAPDHRPVIVEPRATYGCRAVLVRPDRYIAAVER
ncbi:MAG: bifunctional 3-(3-hydroxy-phenyl)propionate/3-hydroxycinnamic acid hydroxylase [Ilumatobacteraceae bacterium]